MINNSKQNWSIGSRVNVGFMRGLEVLEVRAVVDGLPDIYILRAANGKMYKFIPHNGLEAM